MRRFLSAIVTTGAVWSIFQLVIAFMGFFPALAQRALHVGFAVALGLLAFPAWRPKGNLQPPLSDTETEQADPKTERERKPTLLDIALAGAALACGIYIAIHYERLVERIPFVSPLTALDIAVGSALIVLLLEACRRVVGWTLPILALLFLAYQVAGPYLPGLLGHTGINFTSLIEHQSLSVQEFSGFLRVLSGTTFSTSSCSRRSCACPVQGSCSAISRCG